MQQAKYVLAVSYCHRKVGRAEEIVVIFTPFTAGRKGYFELGAASWCTLSFHRKARDGKYLSKAIASSLLSCSVLLNLRAHNTALILNSVVQLR